MLEEMAQSPGGEYPVPAESRRDKQRDVVETYMNGGSCRGTRRRGKHGRLRRWPQERRGKYLVLAESGCDIRESACGLVLIERESCWLCAKEAVPEDKKGVHEKKVKKERKNDDGGKCQM
jgi:hypothetical protein